MATNQNGQISKPECAIYEYIKRNTVDGHLPEGFEIPWLRDIWAPGAQDGVALYHMHPLQPDQERSDKILKALMMMADENNGDYVNEIFSIWEELDGKESIVRMYDEIIRALISHHSEMDLDRLINYGDWLICNGVSLLSVKLGLTVLSPFNVPFVEEVMQEFGVYDEFTYYAARVLSQNERVNGNEELFSLAKNVNGWGRIHAVEYLRPETQEIKDWLLFEGADNNIMMQYSADVCLQKSDALMRLDSDFTAEEFEAIGKLIEAAIEEQGPCPGITDGEQILQKYLDKGDEYTIDPELRQRILQKSKK